MTSARRLLSWLFAVAMFCSMLKGQQTYSAAQSTVVPRLVNFSGKATDSQGKSITGIAGATFAIYKDQYEGQALWLETQNVQADAKGNYTIQLGATKPDGLPLDLFSSGEARWLGVTINGGQEQPRVLLPSVPYALKAADAETIGGLPPSAFVLAAAPNSAASPSAAGSVTSSTSASPLALGGGGTLDFVPLWTPDGSTLGNSVLFQSGTGGTAKVGINTTKPASTLDVSGAETVRGNLSLPATGTATATAGKNSQPTTLTASAFNSSTGKAVGQNFRWQAEPSGNNTSSPSGTLNLLFGSGSSTPTETGLNISSKGQITFASGQTFPGTASVSSVGLSAPGSDFTVSGSPVTNSGTLALNWTVAPTSLNTPNAIVKRDASGNITGGIISAAAVNATNSTLNGTLTVGAGANISNAAGPAVVASTSGANAAITGTSTGTNAVSDGVDGVTSSPSASGVAGINNGGGVGVYGSAPNGNSFYADSNVQQARTAGGWVKAMAFVNAFYTPYNIQKCFNSTLAGPAATTPPCGINFTESSQGVGYWDLDFGFEVDDRFLSVTLRNTSACVNAYPINTTVVEVNTFDCTFFGGASADFFIIVF